MDVKSHIDVSCRPMTNSSDVRTSATGHVVDTPVYPPPPVAAITRLIRCDANMRHPSVSQAVSRFIYLTVVREALLISDDYHDQFI